MKSVWSGVLTIVLTVLVMLGAPLSAAASPLMFSSEMFSSDIAVLPGLKGAFEGTQPDNIGVTDSHLAACPATPNCVVSQGADEEHSIAPIYYEGDRATVRASILDILSVVPRTEVITQNDDYILAKSESRLMGFVDDTEFYFPKDEKVIQVRAAARMGESDLGVNRRRIEQIRLAFNDMTKRAAQQ
ncbi:MAG: DUF1499 domain-containing protein [Cyanobacteria bacterium J06598_1]